MQDNRETRPRRRSPWPLLMVIGSVIASGALLFVFASAIGFFMFRDFLGGGVRSFDAALWRQSTMGCASNPRLGMYGDLADKLRRERPTKAEVLSLLGPPDGEDAATISYALGYNIIDCDSVFITFGADGRVSEVRYLQG